MRDTGSAFVMSLRLLARALQDEIHGCAKVPMPDGSWRWKSWEAAHRG